MNGGEICEGTVSCRQMLDSVPPIVTNNLFYRWGRDLDDQADGLIFATKIKYLSMAFQVR